MKLTNLEVKRLQERQNKINKLDTEIKHREQLILSDIIKLLLPNTMYQTSKGRFCERCNPAS